MRTIPIMFNDYIVRRSGALAGGVRVISVRQFRTTQVFDREQILEGLAKSRLVFGSQFGVIKIVDEQNEHLRALCGLVGQRELVLLNQYVDELDYLRLKNVLCETLMIEFMADSDSNLVFLLYAGGEGQTELWRMLRDNFEMSEEPIPSSFSSVAVRGLCESFFEQLYQLEINPLNQSRWGTISKAEFKSGRGAYIDTSIDLMQQVCHDKEIIIRSFESELRNQQIEPLANPIVMKFHLSADGYVKITTPEFVLPFKISDLQYEAIIYDLARQAYSEIIGHEKLYDVQSTQYDAQLRLF